MNLLDYRLCEHSSVCLAYEPRCMKGHTTSACLTVSCMLLCRGFSYSYDTILQHETLRMTAQAEQMQVTALMAVLPVRLKVLDTAGTQPYSSTVEPDLLLSRPTNSTQAQTAASAADGAAESAQQVWLRYRPGYYEVVYPAQGCEDHDGAM